MPIRTGKQFLDALHDDRRIFIDGERVRDVAADPRFAGAAQSLAELYDMQHDQALHDRMTFSSPSSGEKVGLSFIEPRSVDDLIRRREMIKTLDGRDLRHVRPQPRFPQRDGHRAGRRRAGIRPQPTLASPTISAPITCWPASAICA